MDRIKRLLSILPVLLMTAFIISNGADTGLYSVDIVLDESYTWTGSSSLSVVISGYISGNTDDEILLYVCDEDVDTYDEISGTEIIPDENRFITNSMNISFSENEYEKDLYIYAVSDETIEGFAVYRVYYDGSGPELNININDSSVRNDINYIGTETAYISIGAYDSYAGMKYVMVYLDDEIVYEGAMHNGTSVVNIGIPEGRSVVKVKAIDIVGNEVLSDEYVVSRDLTPPVLNTVIEGNIYEALGITYAATEPVISLSCTDNGETDSGIRQAYIEINDIVCTMDVSGNMIVTDYSLSENDVPEVSYKVNLSDYLSEDNIYHIKAAVSDYGLNTVTDEYNIIMDKEAPVIESVYDSKGNALPGYEGGYVYYHDSGISINVNVKDNENGSGVKEIIYCTVNEGVKSEAKSITPDSNGNATINIGTDFKGYLCIKAVDNVGNISSEKTYGGFICESEEKFLSSSSLDIIMPFTDKRDMSGLNLYDTNIIIKISARSDYAFIKNVEWTLYDGDKCLQSGSDTSGEINIPISYDLNGMKLTVRLYDKAGYVMTKEEVFGIDTVSPKLEFIVTGDKYENADEDFYHDTVTLKMTLTERNAGSDGLSLSVNGVPYTNMTLTYDSELSGGVPAGREGSVYSAEITFNGDETYDIKANYTDLARHMSDEEAVLFIVDETAPTVSVTVNGEEDYTDTYINHESIVTVTVNEKYFDSARINIVKSMDGSLSEVNDVTWINDGDIHKADIKISNDGEYGIYVSSSDRAGNTGDEVSSPSFVIDMTAPVIVVNGISDKSSYNGECAPVIILQDINYDKESTGVILTGLNHSEMDLSDMAEAYSLGEIYNVPDFEYVKDADDIYELNIITTDRAGNESSESISFTVNRFGSDYAVSDENIYLNGSFVTGTGEIVIIENNLDEITAREIYLTHNGITETLDDNDLSIMSEKLTDGRLRYFYLLPKEIFLTDGVYELNIRSEDYVGNIGDTRRTSESLLTFTVDNTEPTVISLNIKDDISINADHYMTGFVISDKYGISSVTGYVGDSEAAVTYENGNYYLDIPEDNIAKDIKITATDNAGNTYTMVIKDVLITTNGLVRFYHDHYRKIGGIMDMLGLFGLAVCKTVRRNRIVTI